MLSVSSSGRAPFLRLAALVLCASVITVACLGRVAVAQSVDTGALDGTESAEVSGILTDETHPVVDGHAAADGHEGGGLLSFDLGSAIWNLVIFLLVLAILSKFVWPSVLEGLTARESKIRSDLEAAQQSHVQAQSLLVEYQKKLDQAAAQVQTMLAEARRDSEANGQRIVDAAKAEAEVQRQRAVADIETAKRVAMAELAGATADMAMNVARSVVGRELRAEDHADLIRQSLDRLPSQN